MTKRVARAKLAARKMCKEAIQRYLHSCGYHIRPWGVTDVEPPWNFLEGLIFGRTTCATGNLVVQIGANDGMTNDPLARAIPSLPSSTKFLMVEPQEDLFEALTETYSGLPNVHLAQVAIGPPGTTKLFKVDARIYKHERYIHIDNPSGIASTNPQHVLNHLKSFLGISESEASSMMTWTEVESLPIPTLLDRLQLRPQLDLLSIDTEGSDDEVIYASELGKLMPPIVNYEISNLPGSRLQGLRDFLARLGYARYQWSESDEVAVLPSPALGSVGKAVGVT